MNAEKVLDELLRTQAINSATAVGLSCQPEWPRGFPRSDRFGEFWYRTDSADRPMVHKGRKALTIGVLQFTIYSPERLGRGYSLPFAQALKDAFERCIFTNGDYFALLGPLRAFEIPGSRNRNIATIIDCTFDYFHPGKLPVIAYQSLFFQAASADRGAYSSSGLIGG